MFCKNCGKELENNELYCANCGAKTQDEENSGAPERKENTGYTPEMNINKDKPKKPNKTGMIIGIVAAILLCLALIGAMGERYAEKRAENDISDGEFAVTDNEEENYDSYSEPENDYITGTVDGSTYENEVFGFGCELPGWTFASDEEIFDNAEVSASYFGDRGDEKLQDAVKEAANVMVMSAMNESTGDNINLAVGKNSTGDAIMRSLDEKLVLEYMNTQIETLFDGSTMKIKQHECVQSELGGEKKYSLKYTVDMYGVEFRIEQFYFFTDSNYAVMTITGQSDEDIAKIRSMFYLI